MTLALQRPPHPLRALIPARRLFALCTLCELCFLATLTGMDNRHNLAVPERIWKRVETLTNTLGHGLTPSRYLLHLIETGLTAAENPPPPKPESLPGFLIPCDPALLAELDKATPDQLQRLHQHLREWLAEVAQAFERDRQQTVVQNS